MQYLHTGRSNTVLFLPGLFAIAACFGPTDYSGSRFLCDDGYCPSGFRCVDEVCINQDLPPGCDLGFIIDLGESVRSVGDTSRAFQLSSATVELDCPILKTEVPIPDFYGPGDLVQIDAQTFYLVGRDPQGQLVLDTTDAFTGNSAPPETVTGSVEIRRVFDTPQEWAFSQRGDLVNRQRREVGILYPDEGVTYKGGIDIRESTTDFDHYMELRGARPHRGIKGQGVALVGPIDNGQIVAGNPYTCITIRDSFTEIRDLEFHGCGGDNGTAAIVVLSDLGPPEGILLERLLISGNGSSESAVTGIGAVFSDPGPDLTLRNSFLFDLTRGVQGSTNSNVSIQNTTIASTSNAAILTGEVQLTNVLALDCGDTCFGQGEGSKLFHCASSDGSASGEQARTLVSREEVVEASQPGLHDLHLRAGSTLRGAGLDLGDFFEDDIDGDARTTWSIGADE